MLWAVPDSTEQYWTHLFWDTLFWPEDRGGIQLTDISAVISGDVLLEPSLMQLGASTTAWQVSTSFDTNIAVALDGHTERRIGFGRPNLDLVIDVVALGESSARLRAWVQRRANARGLIPLLPDAVGIVQTTSVGDRVVQTKATTLTRFAPGTRAVIAQWNAQHEIDFEYGIVAVVGTNSISFTTGLSKSWTATARVIPLLEVHPHVGATQAAGQSSLSFQGTVTVSRNAAALLPLVIGGTLPSGFATLAGYPVLQIPGVESATDSDWSTRFHGFVDLLAPDVTLDRLNDYSADAYHLSMLCKTREQWFSLLRLYHSRSGATYPFWLMAPGRPFYLAQKVADNKLQVSHYGSTADWATVDGISIFTNGGTAYGQVASVVVGALVDEITFLGTPLLGFTNPCLAFEMLFVHFAAPFQEVWHDLSTIQVMTSVDRVGFAASSDVVDITIAESFNCPNTVPVVAYTLTPCVGGSPIYTDDAHVTWPNGTTPASLLDFVTGAVIDGNNVIYSVSIGGSGSPQNVSLLYTYFECPGPISASVPCSLVDGSSLSGNDMYGNPYISGVPYLTQNGTDYYPLATTSTMSYNVVYNNPSNNISKTVIMTWLLGGGGLWVNLSGVEFISLSSDVSTGGGCSWRVGGLPYFPTDSTTRLFGKSPLGGYPPIIYTDALGYEGSVTNILVSP